MARAPKQKTEKYSVNGIRRGELRYDTKYNATDAARSATKLARQGYSVTVQPWASLGTKRNVMMTCEPASGVRTKKGNARCTMVPSFKKQILFKRKR